MNIFRENLEKKIFSANTNPRVLTTDHNEHLSYSTDLALCEFSDS